ncbi:hypothetical protein GCM10028820_19810 [Tessaracoccus terricola]
MIDEQRRQAALDAMQVLDTPPDERVDRVTRLAQEIFDVPMVSVSLLDRDRQWRKSQIGLGGSEAPRKDSFCDYTVGQDASVVIEDALDSEEFAANPFVIGDPRLRFYAGHPLHAPGGEPVGTLCIVDTAPRPFSDKQLAMLRDLASWVECELARDVELDHAAVVEQSLRPQELPVIDGYTLAAGTTPSGRVSGDMFDFTLRDSVLRITLADAMGKGLGPAMAAVFLRASLRTAPERSVLRAVEEADALLESAQECTSMFVTAVHADVDTATGAVELVDAGHGLNYVLRADGSWEELRSTGLPLGMGSSLVGEREVTRTRLHPGDKFISCSDGLLDVLELGDPYGHVARVLRERGAKGAVEEAMRLARGSAATDDTTVIVVERNP